MKSNNILLRGTLLLTGAGILSRIMGFFYRIFLSNTIGAEGMGIYQLIFPVYSVCFSLCASGIETAVSKLTAEKHITRQYSDTSGLLISGLFLTFLLSVFCSLTVFHHAEFIASVFLKEPDCKPLLKLLSLTIPFGTMQSCLCGYFLGIHNAKVPALAQLIEQTFRIGCVLLLFHLYFGKMREITPSLAIIGLICGEFCSFIYTFFCITIQPKIKTVFYMKQLLFHIKEISALAAPLSISRLCINLLAALEAVMIPGALKTYGLDPCTALSIYGVFSGMALPFILFPNALTGSISMMLLPAVSQFQANDQLLRLKNTLKKTFSFCIFLGISCLFFFLIFGDFLGTLVFSSPLAGQLIQTLAWICPFLYLNTTLTSVLNGLGKTSVTFFNGIFSLFVRILFIILLVPKIGIAGYFYGLLSSQLYITLSSCYALDKALPFRLFDIFY